TYDLIEEFKTFTKIKDILTITSQINFNTLWNPIYAHYQWDNVRVAEAFVKGEFLEKAISIGKTYINGLVENWVTEYLDTKDPPPPPPPPCNPKLKYCPKSEKRSSALS